MKHTDIETNVSKPKLIYKRDIRIDDLNVSWSVCESSIENVICHHCTKPINTGSYLGYNHNRKRTCIEPWCLKCIEEIIANEDVTLLNDSVKAWKRYKRLKKIKETCDV